jgi:hypothetical protein
LVARHSLPGVGVVCCFSDVDLRLMTFDKINRRLHLYLGLFLGPWLVMYGVSSFILIHQSWFGLRASACVGTAI